MRNDVLAEDRIYVKSHVSRDLLQNAALFKNEKLVTHLAQFLSDRRPGIAQGYHGWPWG